MKMLWFLYPFAAVLTLAAQTNSTTPAPDATLPALPGPASVPADSLAPTNAPADRAPTQIFSESANFDLKSQIAVYIGHVRVLDPQMKLTCGIMTAHVPRSGKIDSIVAEQNVVIEAVDSSGKPIHATGDRAVYRYIVSNAEPSETIELSGNPRPRVETQDGIWTGRTITWDRLNNSISATEQEMVIRPQPAEHKASPAPATTEPK
jgi:lipopolysaccharide transport protein LptA